MGLDTAREAGKRSRVIPIFECDETLGWGALDLPLVGIARDWDGADVDPAPGYSLACDAESLWFLAHHRVPARAHPDSRPGAFHVDLWKHDVAELFLADPASGRYIEFNLAPNAAWWSCEFTAPRERAEAVEIAFPDVHAWADLAADGAWVAAMAIPLDILKSRIGFGPATRANVSMILGSPQQQFLSAAPLGAGAPDFHRPAAFQPVSFRPLAEIGWS